jgi:hypothetical protein
MNLSDMRALVRRDLHDEDSANYRWIDDELDRHIAHAVRELSEYLPYQQKATLSTVSGSRELDISDLTERVMVEAVEYPVGQFPMKYQPFSLWGDTMTLLGEEIPDGSDAYVYYGKLHTLGGSSSTLPSRYEDLIVTGACGYAALEWGIYSVNRVNVGGADIPGELLEWGNGRLKAFRQEVRRLGRRNKVRTSSLYRSALPAVSKSTDFGP